MVGAATGVVGDPVHRAVTGVVLWFVLDALCDVSGDAANRAAAGVFSGTFV